MFNETLGLTSIVIPVYNKCKETYEISKHCMASIRKHVESPHEVIIIDNDSPYHKELPKEKVAELYDGFRVMQLEKNIGFGAACNLGFAAAFGDYVCCMNSDAELVEDSVYALRMTCQKHGLAVAFPEHFENCAIYKMGKEDRLMFDWYFGAFWVGKRDIIWERFNGFDTETFKMCYYEDTDLWSRLMSKGHKVAGWRGTWVKHVGNASAIPEMSEYFKANRAAYVARWGTDRVVRIG